MEDSVPSLEGFLNLEGISGIPLAIDREAIDAQGRHQYMVKSGRIKR